MKKVVYISGIASANLMMFGCICKIQHWPLASLLLTSGIALFCLLFLPVALINNYREQSSHKNLLLHIVTFITFFMGMMSILFKVQHYPESRLVLLVSLPLPFILFLPVYLYSTRNEKKNGTFNFLGIMFGLVFVAILSVLLSLNVSKDVIDSFAESTISNTNTSTFNNKNVADENVAIQSKALHSYIAELRCKLLSTTGNTDCENPVYDELKNKDNADVPERILKGNSKTLETLKVKIAGYEQAITASNAADDVKNLSKQLFSTADKQQNDITLNWQQQMFPSYHLMIVLDALSQLESNMSVVESELIAVK